MRLNLADLTVQMPRLALGGLRNMLSHLVRPPFPVFFLGWHFPRSGNFVNQWMWVGSRLTYVSSFNINTIASIVTI